MVKIDVSKVQYTGKPPEQWDNAGAYVGDDTWGPPLAKDPQHKKKYRARLQSYLDDPYTLSEVWAKRAKRELNEQPEKLHGEVDELRKLVTKEPGLKSRTDDHFLLAFLRSKRHEVQPAFTALLKYYRIRKLNPTFFALCLPSEHMDLYKLKAVTLLEGYDLLGRPICYFSADFPASKITNLQFVQILVHLLDFTIIDPRYQISGVTILVNLEKQTMAHTKLITIKFLKLLLQIFQGSFPVRMKLIVVCHGSFLFRTMYSILKPFIPEKFKERIHIIGSDLKTLPTFFPNDVQPPDLKGGSPPLRDDALAERIDLVADWLRDWSQYGFTGEVEMTRLKSMDFGADEDPPIPIDDSELQQRLSQSLAHPGEMSTDRPSTSSSDGASAVAVAPPPKPTDAPIPEEPPAPPEAPPDVPEEPPASPEQPLETSEPPSQDVDPAGTQAGGTVAHQTCSERRKEKKKN